MKLRFSLRATVICFLLIAGMLRASYWQWERHLAKKEYIQQMKARLEEPIVDLNELFYTPASRFENLIYRRVQVSGQYDFAHEMVLRNRRYDSMPGVNLITPLKVDGRDEYVLVNRGFIPLAKSSPQERKIYQTDPKAQFVGLVKQGLTRAFYAPPDPEAGPGHAWVDAWLRVDIPNIAKQLPYKIFPVYLEIMEEQDLEQVQKRIINASSDREEILFPGLRDINKGDQSKSIKYNFPVSMFDTVIPPGRHLGYVFEWGAMAVMTFLIWLVLQLRRPTKRSS